MSELTRRQVIAWAAVGLVILLLGGHYLRGQLSKETTAEITAITVGLSSSEDPAYIKVHVAGEVTTPGMYELQTGDRTADALDKAGGPLPSADLDQVNLAAKLTDGQQIIVPGEGIEGAAAMAAASPSASGSIININTATAAELTELDGVGEKTAQKIIDYREESGGFKSIEELLEVPGIGPAKFEAMRDRVGV